MTKKVLKSIYLDPHLNEILAEWADREGVSIGDLVTSMLKAQTQAPLATEHKALGSEVIFATSRLAPGSDRAPISNSYGRGKRFHLGTDGLGWVVPWCGSQNTRREYVVNERDIEESSVGPLLAPDYWCESCLELCKKRSIEIPAPLQRCISGNEAHAIGKPKGPVSKRG